MRISLALLLCLIFSFTNAQKKRGCESSEKTKYDEDLRKKWKNYTYQPISKEEALKPVFKHIQIDYVNQPAQSKDLIDSVTVQIEKIMAAKKIDPKDFEKKSAIRDSLDSIEAHKMIGNISKPLVIKSERKEKKWAILFVDFKYDEMFAFGAGYWISLSEDEGKTWKKYYTGLTESRNYYFKKNSNQPLWHDENHLQIEADIVRMLEPRSHPLPPQYETVKDNALVILDINEIIKDSDEDGLTDIEERNLLLNPFSKDTDGDGIPDSDDNNPRFASAANDFVKLYEGVILGENVKSAGKYPNEDYFIDLRNPLKENKDSEASDEFYLRQTTQLLVTDDINLQRINPKKSKIIILTSKEFEEYQKQYHSELKELNYSPLFKCDKEPNVFLLKSSSTFTGKTEKIIRTKNGWKVITVTSWIS